eukprot:EG_transcript_54209
MPLFLALVFLFLLVPLALCAGPIQIDIPLGKTVIYAVNCGGEEFESPVDGITYEADTYLVGRGQTTVVRALHPVQGNDATLYQSDRSGKHLSYAFPLEKKGFYTLVVKFAETQHRAA